MLVEVYSGRAQRRLTAELGWVVLILAKMTPVLCQGPHTSSLLSMQQTKHSLLCQVRMQDMHTHWHHARATC